MGSLIVYLEKPVGSACLGIRQRPWCKQQLRGGIPRSWAVQLHAVGCAWKTACHHTGGGEPAVVSSSYLPL